MRKIIQSVLWISVFGSSAGLRAQEVSVRKLQEYVSYLADDQLEGRRTGSEGEKKAGLYIEKMFRKQGLETAPGRNTYHQPLVLEYNKNPHGNPGETETLYADNITGFINNHAKYTVVLGAHYDHLGLGTDQNSMEANPEGKIHNGADDNASGIAGILELARMLKENSVQEKYNYLFVAFTGEELGLLGSKKWCESPGIALTDIHYMLNFDMIGRMNDSLALSVSGIGTSDKFKTKLENLNQTFDLHLDSSGVGPSDHTSFYHKKIPVLHFFTGQHSDYHKPGDDIEKINFDDMKDIIEYAYHFILSLDAEPKLAFYETKTSEHKRTKLKVTLGVMPDYMYKGPGLKLDGVSKDKPAEKAGLQGGDILLKIDGQAIKDIYDYMRVLGTLHPGDVIEVLIQRGTTEMTEKVEL